MTAPFIAPHRIARTVKGGSWIEEANRETDDFARAVGRLPLTRHRALTLRAKLLRILSADAVSIAVAAIVALYFAAQMLRAVL